PDLPAVRGQWPAATPLYQAYAAQVAAELGDDPQWSALAEVWQRLGCPYLAAQAQLRAAEASLRAGETRQARALLAAAEHPATSPPTPPRDAARALACGAKDQPRGRGRTGRRRDSSARPDRAGSGGAAADRARPLQTGRSAKRGSSARRPSASRCPTCSASSAPPTVAKPPRSLTGCACWMMIAPLTRADREIRPRQVADCGPGGPVSTVGTYSSSWIWLSKVRLAIRSRATSG